MSKQKANISNNKQSSRQEAPLVSYQTDPFRDLVLRFGGGHNIKNIRAERIATILEEDCPPEEEHQMPEKLGANGVMQHLRKSKKLHDEITEKFEAQYKICGKLIGDWKQHFRLSLPPDPDTATLRELDSQMMALQQEASFLKAVCQSKLDAQKGANKAYFRAKYASLVSEYKIEGKKLPAKDTLSVLAEEHIGDLYDAITHMEIEVAFWKEIIADLYACRKLIENATLNLSVEAKALRNDRYLDAIDSRQNR